MTYKFCKGRSAYPETVSLYLTYRCNLHCKMCGQWGEKGTLKGLPSDILKSELTLDELKSLIDDVATFKPNITLFGGESFLYKEILELIKYIKDANLRCNNVTNGVLLDKYAEDVVDLNMDEIIISFHGTPKIHDEVTQVSGTFDRATRGLELVKKFKAEKGKHKPIINVTTPITKWNYHILSEIADYWAGMDVNSVSFHHLIFFSRETYNKHYEEFRKVFGIDSLSWAGFVREHSEINVDSLLKEFDKIKNKNYNTDVSFYPDFSDNEIRKYYSDEQFVPQTYPLRCISPWMEAYIFPDGSVRPCLSMDYIAGNIKDKPFTKIWNNKQYRRYRKVIKKKVFPVCTKCTEFYRF